MTDKTKPAHDAIMGALHRRATEITALPVSEREARYKIYHDAYYQEGVSVGRSPEAAKDFADRMDEWIKALVGLIENSGGGAGGRA